MSWQQVEPPRFDKATAGQREQLVVDAALQVLGAAALKVGASSVHDEQGVASEDAILRRIVEMTAGMPWRLLQLQTQAAHPMRRSLDDALIDARRRA